MEKVGSSNHKFIKPEAEVRTEVTISVVIRTGIDQIVMTKDNTDKIEVDPDINKIMGQETLEETWGVMVDIIVQESIEIIMEMTVMTEDRIGLESGHFPEAITTIGVQATVGPGQDSGQLQTEIW